MSQCPIFTVETSISAHDRSILNGEKTTQTSVCLKSKIGTPTHTRAHTPTHAYTYLSVSIKRGDKVIK